MVKFSEEAKSLHASDIREILKVTENPEIISFAGGLPAPELFPIDEMMKVDVEILKKKVVRPCSTARRKVMCPCVNRLLNA